MTPHDWLGSAAVRNPTAFAVGDGLNELTFAELDRRVSEVASRLLGQGIEPGSSALLELGEGLTKVVQIHALIRLGVAVVPIDPDLPDEERVKFLGAFSPDSQLGPADGLSGPAGPELKPASVDGTEVLCRIFTGGSTGLPEAIPLTRDNHFMSAVGSALNLGLVPGDRWLCPVTLSHVSGFSILVRSVIYGTGFLLVDEFSTESVFEAIASRGATAASLVPTMLTRLLAEGPVPPGLRLALVGGGPVPADLILEAAELGVPAVPTYGLTEACSQVATSTPASAVAHPESAGLPLPVTDVRIENGEIEVRGPTVSADAVAEDGWLRTGDLGRLDHEGRLYVEGRKDRLILSGGEKVQPVEVEAALTAMPVVYEAAVIGVPDPEWQQAVVAVVVPAPGSTPDEEELRAACRAALSGFKVPKRIVLAERIPLNRAGKPDPQALAALLGE